ncbi:MAG: SMC-Scp complex subunit ScpB [Candidatus Omnitrophota bacterium]
MNITDIKKIIEAILFVSNRAVTLDQLKAVITDVELKDIKAAITSLKEDYQQNHHGIHLMEVAGGYLLCTDPFCEPWLKKLFKSKQIVRLSGPSLETLSIIAYKQPVTRPEIEIIRGVNVEGVLKTLMERGLVMIKGRRESPGRPIVYGTTEQFLEYFGLKSLKDLPPLDSFIKEQDVKVPAEIGEPEKIDGLENKGELQPVIADTMLLEEKPVE